LGPELWDATTRVVGWNVPNVARTMSGQFIGSLWFSLPLFIATLMFSVKATKYCYQTEGADVVRILLFLINLFAAVALYGGMAAVLGFPY
jgi:hypothetical protein